MSVHYVAPSKQHVPPQMRRQAIAVAWHSYPFNITCAMQANHAAPTHTHTPCTRTLTCTCPHNHARTHTLRPREKVLAGDAHHARGNTRCHALRCLACACAAHVVT